MKIKPTILAFNKYYLPGYRAGGPIRTLANMVDRLGDEFDFHIVTLNHDSGENATPYLDIIPGRWTQVGKAQVMYFELESLSIRRLARIVSDLDPGVIYLNSFFDRTLTQRILWARRLGFIANIPVILAPRGEFSEGALNLKQCKKKFYLFFSKFFSLYDNLMWQASSELEVNDILLNLIYVKIKNIHVAMDLAPVEELHIVNCVPRNIDDPLRLCFLSRISPKKNLDFALRVLRQVKSKIVLTIYGPKSDSFYWKQCVHIISSLTSNVQVIYAGEVAPSNIKFSLCQHDLFFFPTRGENYGHVIHEALSSGLPVLISDQTPWNEVFERGVGWALPLDNPSEYARIIDEVSSWDAEHLERTRVLAVEFAREKSADSAVLQANRDLFAMVASEGR